jgi:hypothetical protein
VYDAKQVCAPPIYDHSGAGIVPFKPRRAPKQL